MTFKPHDVKRYRDVARILVELRDGGVTPGRALSGKSLGSDERDEKEPEPEEQEKADRLARHLEEMGPTFVKLGQLLSTRTDLVPPAYVKALSRLQEQVGPVPFEQIRETITEDLGVRLSKLFQEFDPEPLAAASLGQVHKGILRDGRRVAVKVLRPGALEQVPRDLKAIEKMVGLLETLSGNGRGHDIRGFLEEFRDALLTELDYTREADHLERLAANMEEVEGVQVPRPIPDLSGRRVLTMEYVPGRSVAELSTLARLEIDGDRLLDCLYRAYLKQALVDGFVHADPHPGNVFVTEGGDIALLDAGMVAHIPDPVREGCIATLGALAENDGEETATAMEEMGDRGPEFRRERFRRRITELVSRYDHRTVLPVHPGRAMLTLAKVADEEGLTLPPQFALLAKTLLNLDRVAELLAPDFDSEAAVRRHVQDLLAQRLLSRIPDPREMASSLVEAGGVLQTLPKRVERVLDIVERNDLRLHVDVTEWKEMVQIIHRSASHISAGLVLAALIVGASFLMRVETQFQLFGYPGLAILFFLLAAAGGIALVVYILWGERRGPGT